MSVLLFIGIQLAAIFGTKALVNKYPADPEMYKIAEHERRVDAIKESAQRWP
jgi:hypothetical protein